MLAGTLWLRRTGRIAIVTAALLGSIPAAAQTHSAAEVALAREQFRQGMDALRQSQWETARRAFARAYELNPRPIILMNLATAEVQVGHLVEGAEHYREFLRQAVSGREAGYRADAQHTLAELEPRIPHARISVSGLRPDDAIALDDAPLSQAMVGVSAPVDPGNHVLTVRRAGREAARVAFYLREGEAHEATARLEDAAAAGSGPPGGSGFAQARVVVSPHPAQPHAEPRRGGVVASPWFWTAVGVVVVGGAAATVWGIDRATAPTPDRGNVGSGWVTVP